MVVHEVHGVCRLGLPAESLVCKVRKYCCCCPGTCLLVPQCVHTTGGLLGLSSCGGQGPLVMQPLRCSCLQILLQLRMGAHSLPVVLGRRTSTPRAQGFCQRFDQHAVGDKRHMGLSALLCKVCRTSQLLYLLLCLDNAAVHVPVILRVTHALHVCRNSQTRWISPVLHILSLIAMTCWVRQPDDILSYHLLCPTRLELMQPFLPSFLHRCNTLILGYVVANVMVPGSSRFSSMEGCGHLT